VSPAQLAQAKRAFEEGNLAYQVGRFDDAIRQFEEAYRLSRSPKLLFNIAQAERKQYAIDARVERLRRAKELYRTYVRLGEDAELRKLAEGHVRDLDRELVEAQRREAAVRPGSTGAPRGATVAAGRTALRFEVAASDSPALRDAKAAGSAGDYGQALTLLDAGIQRGGNSRAAMIEIQRLRGICAALAGNRAVAKDAFSRLVAIDGEARLPAEVPSEVTTLFLDVVREAPAGRTLTLQLRTPPSLRPGDTLTVQLTLGADPLGLVRRRQVYYRPAGAAKYSSVSADATGLVSLPALQPAAGLPGSKPPAPELTPSAVELYASGLDAYGNVLVQDAAADAPRLVVPDQAAFASTQKSADKDRAWYDRWWVWGIAGGVVAGSAIAVVAANSGGGNTLRVPDTFSGPIMIVRVAPAR
jgi:tetratricopeptide (TPR) repeat protein